PSDPAAACPAAPSDLAVPSEPAVCLWDPLALVPETHPCRSHPGRPSEAPAFLAVLVVPHVAFVPGERRPLLPGLASAFLALRQRPYWPAERTPPSSESRVHALFQSPKPV